MTGQDPGMDADRAAADLAACFSHLLSALPAGWGRGTATAFGMVTGVPAPFLNGVFGVAADPAPDELEALLEDVAARGVPHCLQLRPGAGADAVEVAGRRGLEPGPDVPMMVLAVDGGEPLPVGADGLAIRRLRPEEAPLHAAVGGPAFGAPPELFAQLLPAAALALPGVACYVGSLDGEAVVTGVGVRLGDGVGVFNVGTLDSHRRRGYGGALTARIVEDARADGARYSWLQSSPPGEGVYAALGYRTVERYRSWVS
jgi:GNAT superfamily N-acetyltransferase